MFFLNSIYPYLKDGSIKIYNYSRKKAKKMYKKAQIYMKNTYLYYNNTPDIENQIEYLNYSGLSSSINDISVHSLNQNNKVYLSLNDIHNIESELTGRKNKLKKYANNKNWMKIRKMYKNRYIYKLPYRHLYNLNDDLKILNEEKVIQIINKYYYDHLFIKAIKSYFNLSLRKLYIKWNNKRKKANQSTNNISNIINFENIINNKSIKEESIEFNINNENRNKNSNEIVNESNSINKIDELFNFNETNNYEISELSKNNILDNNLDILNNNNLKNNSLYSKSNTKLENNLKQIKINYNFNNNKYLHQRYEDEDEEDQKIKDNEEILKEKNNKI